MGRMCKRKAKLNNAGMTLVEILVAIAILSVAIIPLMFAFVNSMRYNARGRELQQTTVLAHTIIENCKADTFDEVKSSITGGNFVPGGYTQHTVGNTFYLQNVKLENQMYDVKIDFTSHAIGTDTSYNILRSVTMNPYLDAMLTVHTPDNTDPLVATPHTLTDMDAHAYVTALEDIAAGIKTASQDATKYPDLVANGVVVDLPVSEIEDSFKAGGTHENRLVLKRDTTINIGTDASGNEVATVIYTYSYEVVGGDYSYTYTDVALALNETVTYTAGGTLGMYTYEIYSNSNTKAEATGVKLENIYIMYYPAYSTSSGTTVMFPFDVVEEITINNNLAGTATDPRETNVYLVKQKNTNYTDGELTTLDVAYAAEVKVTGNTVTNARTNVYHNFDYNLGTDTLIVSPWSPTQPWTGVERKESMITTESKTLMYDFVVSIYKKGAINTSGGSPVIDSNAQLILTMDGTDLDW